MVGLGQAASDAVIAGRRAITKPMRTTLSIGQDIAGGKAVHEAQIPGTQIGL